MSASEHKYHLTAYFEADMVKLVNFLVNMLNFINHIDIFW